MSTYSYCQLYPYLEFGGLQDKHQCTSHRLHSDYTDEMDDGFMDERCNGLDDLEALDQQHHHHHHKLELTAAMLGQGGSHHDEEGGTTDTATTENSQKHEKDSGVGRTDGDSTRNDESSEQEMMENECISPGNNAQYSNGLVGSADHHYSNDSFTSNETGSHDHDFAANDIPAEECQKFREVLETRCSGSGSEGSSAKSATHLPRKDSQSSIEREIAALNQEMEHIQMQCQEIVETHTREQHRVSKDVYRGGAGEPGFRSPRMVPRMGTRLDYIKQLQGVTASAQEAGGPAMHDLPIWVRHEQLARVANQVHREAMAAAGASDHNRNTKYLHSQNSQQEADGGKHSSTATADTSNTSAYNTGDSSRSTPLTLELHQAPCDPNDNVNGGKHGHKNSMLSLSVAPTSTSTATSTTKPSHSDSEKLQQQQQGSACTGGKKDWCSDGDAKGLVSKSQSSTSVSRITQTGELDPMQQSGGPGGANSTLQELYTQYADVMYTNQANLQHTIMVQQKLFQQQLMQRARSRASSCSNSSAAHHIYEVPMSPTRTTPQSPAKNSHPSSSSPAKSRSKSEHSPSHSKSNKSPSKTADHSSSPAHHHHHTSPQHTTETPQQQGGSGGGSGSGKGECDSNEMEWVVKRRADGSRYITRRPIRNKLLKERAKKLNEERCGMTTDDDAVSELKVGRYWNKEERKRHLEKARDRKQKKEQMLRQRMETVKEQEESGRKEPNIVELSHRKMMRHKGKKVLDDFTTLHEVLAHGTRDPTNSKQVAYNPLLSVTTV